MNVTEKELKERYKNKETEELMMLYKDGGLIDIAMKVLREELQERGVPIEDVIKKTEKREKDELQAAASKTIKNSTMFLLFIGVLQILVSIVFQFYLGLFFGLLMVILASGLITKRSQGPALAIIFMGIVSFFANFIGPLITKMAWGNSVLSLIIIWLGMRCKKAAKILNV